MIEPTYLVTAAAGKTGSAVALQLLAQGQRVRAVVRGIDARSERLRAAGAEIATADMFDVTQLQVAMRGTQRAYFCPPFHPHMLQAAAAFAVAARSARLESVVGLTQWLASPSHPSVSTRQHWLVDQLLAMLPGVAHTIVSPGFFASYPFLAVMPYAAHLGLFPMPADPRSENAPPSDEDIAAVVVAALRNPARHDGRTWRPTGPEMISVQGMADILGRVLGRKVRHARLPMWMFLRAARADGVSAFELSNIVSYLQDQSDGAFALGGVTRHVEDVTGRPAESFESVARRYAMQPANRRSPGNTVRTLGKFLSVPMRRGFDAGRFRRQLQLPDIASPRQAMANDVWKMERSAVATPDVLAFRPAVSA